MEAYASSSAAASASLNAATQGAEGLASNTILLVLVRSCWRFILNSYYCFLND